MTGSSGEPAMSSPDLSIIIPTYNRLPLLQEALASFAGGLACACEIIIVDDGSADGTPAYLRTLGAPYRALFQDHRGSNAARNAGLRAARGRYVKFLDDDDWLNAQQVDAQVAFLDAAPEYDIAYSDHVMRWVQTGAEVVRRNRPVDDVVDAILSCGWAGCPTLTLIVRAGLARQVMWDEAIPRHQEMDFLLRLALHGGRAAYLPGNAGWYRVHGLPRINDSGDAAMALSRLAIFTNAQAFLERTGQLTEARREMLAFCYYDCAERLFFSDRAMFRSILADRVFSVCPAFAPARPRFMAVARRIGYEKAVWLRLAALRLRAMVKRPGRG